MKRSALPFAAAILAAGAIYGPSHAWIAQKPAASASTQQQLWMSSTTAVSSSATRWIPFGMAFQASTTELTNFRFPVGGTILSLKVHASTAPSSASYAGTIRLNGADSSATCSVSSATPCTWTGSLAIAAGDTAGLKIVPTSSPAASMIHASVIFQPTTPNDTVIAFGTPSNNFANNSTQYLMAGSGVNPNVLSGKRFAPVPDAGTIDKLCALNASAPGSGTSFAYTLYKSGAAAALTTTIADTATTNCDNSNSFTVAAPSGGSTPGDDIALESVPSGTPTASKFAGGARFVPTTAGHFATFMVPGAAVSTTAVTYYALTSGISGGSATEADRQSVAHAQSFKMMTCRVSVAPGGSTARVCTLRVNGSNSSLTCTITGSATACNVTATVAVNDDDLVAIADDPTTAGTPASAIMHASLLATR